MPSWGITGFEEVRELGRGTQGRVVLARHVTGGPPVAIKYLPPGADPAARDIFRHEAEMLARVRHPNVARLFRLFESADGAALVMELVDGVSLKRVLADRGALTPEASLLLLKGSLLGLAAAHADGVVHRDYKPANVIVRGDGVSKLIDFGVAARIGHGGQVGTPAYMAPEQWRGEPAAPAADVYAAACVFYECVTGRRPYPAGTGPDLMAAHVRGPVPTADVPAPLRGLVARGLAKSPDARPPGAAAFVAELEDAAARAYGPDWEHRAVRALALAAVALASTFPLAAAALPTPPPSPDTPPPDAAAPDASPLDAATLDASPPDVPPLDAAPDAIPDLGPPDAATLDAASPDIPNIPDMPPEVPEFPEVPDVPCTADLDTVVASAGDAVPDIAATVPRTSVTAKAALAVSAAVATAATIAVVIFATGDGDEPVRRVAAAPTTAASAGTTASAHPTTASTPPHPSPTPAHASPTPTHASPTPHPGTTSHGTQPTDPPDDPPDGGGHFGPTGYGGVELGMTDEELKATGQAHPRPNTVVGECRVYDVAAGRQGAGTTLHLLPRSGVVAIFGGAGLRTPEGIGVGSTVAELRAAYPASERSSDGWSTSVPGNPNAYYTSRTVDGEITEFVLRQRNGGCFTID